MRCRAFPKAERLGAERVLNAVGSTVWVNLESQIDAVTGDLGQRPGLLSSSSSRPCSRRRWNSVSRPNRRASCRSRRRSAPLAWRRNPRNQPASCARRVTSKRWHDRSCAAGDGRTQGQGRHCRWCNGRQRARCRTRRTAGQGRLNDDDPNVRPYQPSRVLPAEIARRIPVDPAADALFMQLFRVSFANQIGAFVVQLTAGRSSPCARLFLVFSVSTCRASCRPPAAGHRPLRRRRAAAGPDLPFA